MLQVTLSGNQPVTGGFEEAHFRRVASPDDDASFEKDNSGFPAAFPGWVVPTGRPSRIRLVDGRSARLIISHAVPDMPGSKGERNE